MADPSKIYSPFVAGYEQLIKEPLNKLQANPQKVGQTAGQGVRRFVGDVIGPPIDTMKTLVGAGVGAAKGAYDFAAGFFNPDDPNIGEAPSGLTATTPNVAGARVENPAPIRGPITFEGENKFGVDGTFSNRITPERIDPTAFSPENIARARSEAQQPNGIDFSVSPETMDALKTSNAIAKARAYQALPENQRGRMSDDVARVLGVEQAPPIQNNVMLGQQYVDETAAQNARVSAAADLFRAKAEAKNAAASVPRRYRGQTYEGVLKTLTSQQPEGPSASNALDVARFDETQRQNAIQNDIDTRRLGLDEQKIQDQRAQVGVSALQKDLKQEYLNRKEQRESASAQQNQVAQNYELGQQWQKNIQIPEGLDLDTGNQLSQVAWQMSGGDPGRASDILNAMLNDINDKTSGEFASFDPRNTRSVIENIQKRLQQ